MTFQDTNNARQRNGLKVIAWLLLACSFTMGFAIPSVDAAEQACPDFTLQNAGSEQVQLIGCTFDVSNDNNNDSVTLTAPAGLLVGDFLMVQVSTDSSNETLTPPAGWTEVAAGLGGEDISSNVWTRVVTNLTTDIPGTTEYTFEWSNEQSIGYLLHLRGASGGFGLTAAVQGNSSTPTSPAITALSPDNLIIRMGSIDRGEYLENGSQNFTNYNDLLQRNNNGGGNNNRKIGVTASYGQVNESASAGDLNFSLDGSNSDGSHNRTFSIEPYEFRFAVANVTSSVCTIEQVTLSVTDRSGIPLPWGFTGTVDLSPTSSTGGEVGALWSGGSGGLSAGVNGNQTYTFDGTEGSTITLNYSNPNVGIVDFDIAFGNFSESTNTNYTAPTLDVLGCGPEFRFSMTDTSSSVCAVQLITLQAVDASGSVLTGYVGTVDLSIVASVSNVDATWTEPSGGIPGILTNGVNGAATFEFVAADNGSVDLEFFIPTGGGQTVDFDVVDNGGGYSESPDDVDYTSPTLSVLDCEFVIAYAAGNEIGTCGIERLTVSLLDTAGNPATNYSGTMTIDNNNGSAAGSYSFVSGAFGGTFADNSDGTAEYAFTINSLGTDHIAVMDYTHESTTQTNIDFLIDDIDDGGSIQQDAGNPTLTVTACEIRISYTGVAQGTDALSDTCSPTGVTISVNDETGTPINGYTGTIRITNDQAIGTWSQAVVTGILDNASGGDTNNGQADYTFQAAENGSKTFDFSVITDVGPNIDLQIVETSTSTFVTSPAGIYDADIDILPCTWDFQIPTNIGSCVASNGVTVTIRGRDTLPVTDYVGQIQIQSSQGLGNYALVDAGLAGGLGTADNGAGGGTDNGIFTYTFSALDNGFLDLEYSTTSAITPVTFTVTALTPAEGELAIDGGAGNVTNIADCDLVITLPDANLIRNVCTMTRVSFEVQVNGSAVTNFDGVINLTAIAAATGQGKWYENLAETYPGGLTGGGAGDGTASYDFDGTEGGNVIFDFRNAVAVNNLDFGASGVASNGAPITLLGVPPQIDISACTLTITTASVSNTADVCRGGESVTYTLSTPGTTDFSGTMVMQTSTGFGNYVKTAGISSLVDPGGNDGFATYTFDPADSGVLVVDYSVLAVPTGTTATLLATIPDVTVINTDGILTFRACEFRISFPADTVPFETDVCSIKQVQIQIVDGAGTPAVVDDYTGIINLTTSTGFGSWAENPADNDGTLTDPFGEDGAASYTFDDLDDGVVLLNFTHTAAAAASLNINVTDSVTSDPGSPGSTYDPILLVDLCTFQISFDGGGGSTHSDAEISACTVQEVTIEVFDSAGSIATDYAGQINISTSTNNGNWSIDTGEGALSNAAVDGGAVSYTFNDDGIGADDNGVVMLNFSNLNAETVNFNIVDEVIALGVDGVVIEEGAADPNLVIGSCIPAVAQRVCATGVAPSFTISLPIDAQDPNLLGRMVAVGTVMEGPGSGALRTVSDVQFNSVSFNVAGQAERLIEVRVDENASSYATLWAMNEVLLPTVAGSYNVEVFHDNDAALAACAFFLTDVEQTLPAEDLITPVNGQVNATGSPDNTITVASTQITTTKNNALLLSIVGIGNPADTLTASPSPPLYNFSPQPSDPPSAGFGGASGNLSAAGLVTVDQTMSIDPTFRHTHIVAAFNPLIQGSPQAEGYEPVVLFKAYSGNVSYRAIGGSFQTAANGAGTCTVTNTASATLTLPDQADGILAGNGAAFSANGEFDSDIKAAWLYWFASASTDLPNINGGGTVNGQIPADFDNVTLTSPDGNGGTNVTSIAADDIFYIDDITGYDLDYYSAFKDVTEVLVGSDNELTGSDENPNGEYTVTNLALDAGLPWTTPGACAGGFALIVIYENPYEQLRAINLFHGFQPFLNSAFTLVPRNFRVADRNTDRNEPNGQISHITVEGDAGLGGANEGLTLQSDPTDFDPTTFSALTTDFNPLTEEFNGTITRPIYTLQDIVPAGLGDPTEYAYIFKPTAPEGDEVDGNPSNGYELDFPNPTETPFSHPEPAFTQYGTSYGLDIDTHFIDGDEPGDLLYLFANPADLSEDITTRYSADGDLVLLVSEIISVTNDDMADIEVTITEADPEYKINTSTGSYNIEVKNNGSGAIEYGRATGIIELVGELPAGMTLNSAVSGTGWICSSTVDSTTAFTCSYDASTFDSGNGLGATPLPIVTAVVNIDGPPANFPSVNNDAKVIVRVQHSDGTCVGASTGVLPTPTSDCEAPEFDNINDLAGGALDINDLEDKTASNNNVDSITSNVKGIETDLSVIKAVTTILEEGSVDSILYTISVTNNGPDNIVAGLTQPAMTITDIEPVGVNFDSASGDFWTCAVISGVPDQLVCTFDNSVGLMTPLNIGETSVITIVGDVTGSSPATVTNTVQVSSGTYNFDTVPGNNTFGTTDNISALPAAPNDKYLLSVSALGNVSLGSAGGLLSNFIEDDIVLYDPLTDSAELFIDSATTPGYAVSNPNAIHLLPNGQLVLSANDNTNVIGTNGLMFDKDDIVVYDKLRNTAVLLFDGSALITDVADGIDLNIDSVYVLADGKIIFSTAGPAGDGGAVSWSDSDLVLYDPVLGAFSIYLDAEDDNVFDAVDAQVDAAYLRIDPTDATMVLDTFVVSSAVQGAVLGDNNVIFGRDDVAEIEVTTGTPPVPTGSTSTKLFNGGIPIGVFDTTDPVLTLNALHVVEPAHLGHYEISEVAQGNACTPARIRIRKHLGTSHDLDTSYTGSIVISTDLMPENGIWALDTGQGVLDNSYGGSSDNGQALYTFFDDGAGGSADDDGEVILTLDVTDSPVMANSVNLTVTNGFTVDGDTADNPFVFNLVSTTEDYRDDFSVAALNNSDGSAGWATNWTEVDAFNGTLGSSGAGMTTGNIRMSAGKLTLTSNNNTASGSINPSMTRSAGLGAFAYTEPVFIKFDYGFQSVNAGGDQVELQISNDGSNFITVQTYASLDGTSVSDIVESIDISANIISVGVPGPTEILINNAAPNLYVRWVVTQGYVLGTFTVDNFQVTTSTTACSTASLAHYHIDIPATGLACVTSNVTVTGHDFGHNDVPIPDGTLLTLTTSNGSGSWVNTVGSGTLADTNTLTDGQGTYELTGGAETSIQLQFNYTDPAGDGAAVSINVSDGIRTEQQVVDHDPESTFSEAGIVFYDQDSGNLSTTLPFQIAGKPSLTAPASGNVTLQIVRSTLPIAGENAAAACESLVDDGDTVTVTLAGLCIDPMGCDAGASSVMTIVDSNAVAQNVPVFSSPTANPEQQVTATDLTLQFSDLGSAIGTVPQPEQNIGASLNFMYPNSGKISLHAEYEIPLDNDIAGTLSGDTINGASGTFIVRPFGFDIDFTDDRGGFGGVSSLAVDADGPAFARAGVGFNATVSAVLWEQGDDVELVNGSPGNDGIPDFEADLSNNIVATNFGDEAVDNNTVEISVIINDPTSSGAANPGVPGGVTGSMVTVDGSSDIFQAFGSGVSGPQLVGISEVGIFDLAAELVDDNINRRAINYFDSDFNNYLAIEGVAGGTRNVGRIYPNNFELINSSFGPRTNQSMVCAPASSFTYMGEDFYVMIEIEAKNFQGITTQNYFDDFAKLKSFAELDMRAIVDVENSSDTDLTARLVNTSVPTNFDQNQVDKWELGVLRLSGDMNVARLVDGEDAPLTNVKISFNPNDNNVNDSAVDDLNAANDVLLDVFDVDLDDGSPDVDPLVGPWQYAEIGSHEFRYGRLLVENAYGSEFEDLDIGIVIEYYDGANFVVNDADSCTAIGLTFPAAELDFVADSYEDFGGPDTFEAGDTVIENGIAATVTVFQGRTARLADGDDDEDNDTDRPFFTTAPLNEETGRVLVEPDLSLISLPFLQYDWRGGAGEVAGDMYDEEPEGANYDDNPRGIIEFGSYRGHDRVLNWQEIFVGSGQ